MLMATHGVKTRQITKVLSTGPKKLAEVAHHLGLSPNDARAIMLKMVQDGKVALTTKGTFRVANPS